MTIEEIYTMLAELNRILKAMEESGDAAAYMVAAAGAAVMRSWLYDQADNLELYKEVNK